MKKDYLSPTMVVIPIILELSLLESASGDLPKGSEGHSMDDEDEEYEMDEPATPSVPAKHTSILS
ncbi:hypothetical protein [Prevotella melaninogenica]|uniref:hypothetical protein n=1 Tax=Prevotella melaninogenica TaxID=28132 RepID=UPI001C5E1150|nr:hypothetical protein [Prevotella melaninogenica]MBW4895550.1 hypothetical protein [Prevotella melaninogenica]